MLRTLLTTIPALLASLLAADTWAEDTKQYDVVVYGGTSAGVTAAVQTARMGKSVVLIEPGRHLGGLTTSGLGWTDSGNKAVIGGLSREFYRHIRREYDNDAAWVFEQKSDYGRYDPRNDAMWTFEPNVAEKVMNDLVREAKVPVVFGERLDLEQGVKKEGTNIVEIVMESGRSFRGRRFIDATYEGDLMAGAGVAYVVGREPNSKYGETLNGVQTRRATKHQFVRPVDPYVRPGDPSSGLLPGINVAPGTDGSGDSRLQAYNYRICMTDAAENRIPFEKPAGYDPLEHELLLRNFEAGDLRLPLKIDMMPNRKTDLNNKHAVSTDYIGRNYAYPEADYATRAKILKAHETYVRGFLWTLANHPRVPVQIRRQVSRWGLAKDEFTDNDSWPYVAYIREARRMVGRYVHTELDCRRLRVCDDPIAMGSYNMDSHNVQRYVDEQGHVRNEGDIQVSPGGAYSISYRAIVPKPVECTNLLVPVCLSASHIAFGSIRMEPVFMVLGQSAATAACLSIDEQVAVGELQYAKLKERLLADGQVLAYQAAGGPSLPPIDPRTLKGIVADDDAAKLTGQWPTSTSVGGYVGAGYLHDNAEGRGEKSARYQIPLKQPGRYEVRLAYTPHANRATNVSVTVHHADGQKKVTVDQRKKPPLAGAFVSLGKFRFTASEGAAVVISNAAANGYVIADAVWLLPIE